MSRSCHGSATIVAGFSEAIQIAAEYGDAAYGEGSKRRLYLGNRLGVQSNICKDVGVCPPILRLDSTRNSPHERPSMPRTLLLLLVTVTSVTAQDRWLPTNGPYGGHVNWVAASRTGVFYATTYTGAYRSFDNGANWSSMALADRDRCIRQLALDSNDVLHAVSCNGILRSYDHGDSWDRIGGEFAEGMRIAFDSANNIRVAGGTSGYARYFKLKSDSSGWSVSYEFPFVTPMTAPTFFDLSITSSGVMLGAIWERGVYYCLPRSTKWTAMHDGLGGCLYARAVRMLPDGSLLAGTTCGLFRSPALGERWARVESPIGGYDIYAINTKDDTVLVATYGFAVYRSTDRGVTWEQQYDGLEDPHVFVFARTSNLVIAATEHGVHMSSDGGHRWREINKGLGEAQVNRLAVNHQGHVFATTITGVFRTTDRGAHWKHINYKLTERRTQGIYVDPLNRIWVGSRERGRLYRSIDNGESWDEIVNTPAKAWIESIQMDANGTIYIGVSSTDGGVYRSTDDGVSWDTIASRVMVSAMALGNNGDLVIARWDGRGALRYRPSDGSVTPSLSVRANMYNVAYDRRSGLWYISSESGFYNSSDGVEWTMQYGGHDDPWGVAVDSSGRVRVEGGVLAVSPDGTVYQGLPSGGVYTLYGSGAAGVGRDEHSTIHKMDLSMTAPRDFLPSTGD